MSNPMSKTQFYLKTKIYLVSKSLKNYTWYLNMKSRILLCRNVKLGVYKFMVFGSKKVKFYS